MISDFIIICICLICEYLLAWFVNASSFHIRKLPRQFANQLTRLICVPVKRLFRDTSSLALALEVSCLIAECIAIHALDDIRRYTTSAGNMEFQMSILHVADSVAVSKPIHAPKRETADRERGEERYGDRAILQKDFSPWEIKRSP